MQKLIYISILCLCIAACQNSEQDTPPVEVNILPEIPQLVFPTNSLLCIDNVLEFKWNISSDANGDVITYEIDIAKDNQFTEIAHTASSMTTSQTFTLEKGLAYYWRVRATDSKSGFSAYSPTFNLYTASEGISNHLPFSPDLVMPLAESSNNSGAISLEWIGSDIDEDPLHFDVYFGTDNPPASSVSDNQNETTFEVTTVADTQYYWKVVAKDDKGGQTISQIWNFKTN